MRKKDSNRVLVQIAEGTSNFPGSGTQKGAVKYLVHMKYPCHHSLFLRLLVPLTGSTTGLATFSHCRSK